MQALRLALVVVALLVAPSSAFATHQGPGDRDCPSFSNQQQAQAYFQAHGGPQRDPDRLDGDNDGIACESLPCPCSDGAGAAPPPAIPGPPAIVPAPVPTPLSPEPAPRDARRRIVARIISVVDGDTIRVRTDQAKRITVRLIGIDTPETVKPGNPVECGGAAAARNLRRLSFKSGKGLRVALTTDPTQDQRDRYGRLLAYARVSTGKDLQVEQLRAGVAVVYVFRTAFQRLSAFRLWETSARSAGRGAWTACGGDFHRPG